MSKRRIIASLLVCFLGSQDIAREVEASETQIKNIFGYDQNDLNKLEEKYNQLSNRIEKNSNYISLDEAYIEGLRNNATLKQYYYNVVSKQWEKVAAFREWMPKISLYGYPAFGLYSYTNSTYYKNPNSTSSGSSVTTNTTNSTGTTTTVTTTTSSSSNPYTYYSKQSALTPYATLQWTFFDLARGSKISAKSEEVESAKFVFDSSARNILLDIANAYYSLQAELELIKQYKNILEITRKSMLAVNAQRQAGLKDYGDTAQVATQYFSAMNKLIDSLNNIISGGSTLAKLIQEEPDASLLLPSEALTALDEWNQSLQDSLKHGLEFNENIYNALAESKSYSLQKDAELQSYWPKLFLYAVGYYNRYNGTNYAPIGEGGSNSYYDQISKQMTGQIGIGFSWEFDGGISLASANSFENLSLAKLEEVKNKRSLVVEKVKAYYGQYETQQMKMVNTNRGLSASEASQTIALEKYQLGLSDITTLVQAIQLYSTAVEDNIHSIKKYNEAISELHRWSAQWPSEITEDMVYKYLNLQTTTN